jgi:hypothetical protein
MSGNEEPPNEEGWHDETTDRINELARMLGAAGSDEVDQDGSHADNLETLDPLTVSRDVPELRIFLNENSSVRPERVLVLSFAPSLIGGFKSHEFVVKGQHLSPDASPDEGETVDPQKAIVPAQSWDLVGDYYRAAEHQADQQYGEALFAVRQMMAEAQSRGVPVQTLLLPGTVRVSADRYFRRLQRLAQDTGIEVVIRTEDVDDEFTHYEFRRFTPPVATTVEAYWQARGQALAGPEAKRITDEPAEQELTAALSKIGWREDLPSDPHRLYEYLATIASASPNQLEQSLDATSDDTIRQLTTICELAYGEGDVLFYNRGAARVILAKLGSLDNLAKLFRETVDGAWGQTDEHIVPLGIHARYDPEARAAIRQKAEDIIGGIANKANRNTLRTMLGALYRSYSPACGTYLADHLTLDNTTHPAQKEVMQEATIEWMGDYVDVVQTLPDSTEKTETLHAIEANSVRLLMTTPEERRYDEPDRLRRLAGDILLKMDNPAHEPLLRQYMLWLFKDAGSLVTSPAFEHRYLQFRKKYGDISEISQYIRAQH